MTETAFRGPTRQQLRLIFIGLMVGNFLSSLDSMVVITALPTIAGDLGGLEHVSWIITAYLLTSTTSAPIYGKLSDLYGRKTLYQFAIATFVLGSVLCACAQNMSQLIGARAVQGLGAGGIMVLALAILGDVVSPRERGRYQGMMSANLTVASVAGPVVGGFFVDHASWRWVFLLNLPMGIIALGLSAVALHNPVRRVVVRHKFDLTGMVCLVGAATAVLLAISWGGSEYEWDSPVIVGLIVTAAVLFGVLPFVESRAAEPMLPLEMFRSRNYTTVVAGSMLLSIAMYGAWVTMPMFLQVVTGASAANSGLLTFPLLFSITAASIFVGRAVSRTGHYRVYPLYGSAFVIVGLILYSTLNADSSRLTSSLFMVVVGIGSGLWMQVTITAGQNSVDYRHLGVGTSTINFFRNLGGSIGATLALTTVNGHLNGHLASRLTGEERSGLSESVVQGNPGAIAKLAPALRHHVETAFAASIHDAFLFLLPFAVVAFVVMLRLKETPLSETTPMESAFSEGFLPEPAHDPEILATD